MKALREVRAVVPPFGDPAQPAASFRATPSVSAARALTLVAPLQGRARALGILTAGHNFVAQLMYGTAEALRPGEGRTEDYGRKLRRKNTPAPLPALARKDVVALERPLYRDVKKMEAG